MKSTNTWSLKYLPREWQIAALGFWKENFKGIVKVVTGGGKTVFAFLCIGEFIKLFPEKKVLIVVPTITLLDQWFISLQDEFGVNHQDISFFSGEAKAKKFNKINILVVNTARKVLPLIESKGDYFLIVDECHRLGSPINKNALEGEYAATLGLSATPERDYDNGFQEHILPSLGKIIFDYDYKKALRDGVICKYQLINIKIDFLEHEQTKYDHLSKRIHLLTSGSDVEDAVVKEKIKSLLIQRARISANALMRFPVTSKIAEDNKFERVIIFHESIEGANLIYKTLKERNQNVTIYHSKIGINLRRDNLRLYRNGSYRILVTCKALDEGMNAPETTIAIIASSTASSRQRIQRLGRVLRPAKNKLKAVIYTLFATTAEKVKLEEEQENCGEGIEIKWYKSSIKNG